MALLYRGANAYGDSVWCVHNCLWDQERSTLIRLDPRREQFYYCVCFVNFRSHVTLVGN